MADLMPMVHAERASSANSSTRSRPSSGPRRRGATSGTCRSSSRTSPRPATSPRRTSSAASSRPGFNFDKTVDRDLRNYSAGTPADVKARYDAIIMSNRKPPGPAYVALGEVMVHGEDIRRAQGARGEHPAEHLVTLAEMYKKTGLPLHGKKRVAGSEAAGDRCRLVDRRRSRGHGTVHVVDHGDGRPRRRARRLRRRRASRRCAPAPEPAVARRPVEQRA